MRNIDDVARVRRHHAVYCVQRNAAGVVVAQEIVANDAVVHPVAVDTGPAEPPVLIDDLILNGRELNHPGWPLALGSLSVLLSFMWIPAAALSWDLLPRMIGFTELLLWQMPCSQLWSVSLP